MKISYFSHHAYCFAGGDCVSLVKDELKKDGIKMEGNPDFFFRVYDSLVLDDIKEIRSFHSIKPIDESGKKIFIIKVNGIASEAQNALLKILEEPASYAHFYFFIPSLHILLPTVKSRMKIVELKDSEGKNNNKDESYKQAEKFLESSPKIRLEMTKEIIEGISKEKMQKQDAIQFVNNIEKVIYIKHGPKNGLEALTVISSVRKYMTDRSPSIKMILEYLAVRL